MKGFMTYFFEQHKRLVLGYSVVLLVAMIFAVSLKTTTVPAAVTILYVSIFASLATVASLNSDREIDQLLSLPGGRRITGRKLSGRIISAHRAFTAA